MYIIYITKSKLQMKKIKWKRHLGGFNVAVVKNFLTITICDWRKAKKLSNNKLFVPYINLLAIAEVNYLYRHSKYLDSRFHILDPWFKILILAFGFQFPDSVL